jgi:hypothetical protein
LAVAVSEGAYPRKPPCPNCTEEQKEIYGCVEDATDPNEWITFEDESVLKQCPYRLVTQKHTSLIQDFSLIESGILPCAGGWGDQSASWVKAMYIIAAAKKEFKKDAGPNT